MASPPDSAIESVNIVMRTKNRPVLLARALDDVLSQEFQDWFLTIVNDGGSPEIVDALVESRWPELGQRVRVLHNAHSRGMEAASNQGIESRESEFVAIHDDDDTWSPRFLAATVDALRSDAVPAAVAVTTAIVWEALREGGVEEISREVFLPERVDVHLADLLRFNTCVPISILYRQKALREIGLFDETLQVAGDWEAHVRLAARGSIAFLAGEPLAFWHQRPSVSGDMGNSVIAADDAHRHFDRAVRDRELRSWVQQNGAGLPLYLTRYLDDRFAELHVRLDQLREQGDRAERAIRRWPLEALRNAARRMLSSRRS